MPAQAVLVLRALTDDVLAMVKQQPDLHRALVEVGDRQVLGTLAQAGARDHQRVDRVRLAAGTLARDGSGPSASAALAPPARPRRPGSARSARRHAGSPRSPRFAPRRLAEPRQAARQSPALAPRPSAHLRAGRFPQTPRRRCGSVCGCPLQLRSCLGPFGWLLPPDGPPADMPHLGRCHAPIRSNRGSSGGGGRHNGRRSVLRTTADLGVSPPPPENQPAPVGHQSSTLGRA